jgi:hypothetical protein
MLQCSRNVASQRSSMRNWSSCGKRSRVRNVPWYDCRYRCTCLYHSNVLKSGACGRCMPSTPHRSLYSRSSRKEGLERHLTRIRSCMRPPQTPAYGTPGSVYLFPLSRSLGIPLARVRGFVLGHEELFFRFLRLICLARTQTFVGGRFLNASWKDAVPVECARVEQADGEIQLHV